MHATTADLLLARAEDDGEALLFEDDRWTWRELLAEAAVRAGVLGELRPADAAAPWHVGVLMDNTPEYLFLIAGAALCGATVVGVNPTRRGAGLAADVAATDCAVVLAEPQHAGLLDGHVDANPDEAVPVVTVDAPDYRALLSSHAGAPVAATDDAHDPATRLLLLFTSGSTGAPKAVVCSTGRFAQLCQVSPLVLARGEVAYNAMPMFHGNALMASWGTTLLHGATFATRRRFSASGFADDVRRFGATYFNYVGRSLAYVLAQPERPAERDNVLRFGFGTEASARDRAEFERRFGCPVVESYGSSEGMAVIRRLPETPPGALGLPPEGFDIDVVDDQGRTCPPARLADDGRLLNGEEAIGEIVSRGAAVRFEGYYGNPEATAEKLRDGDFHTGDLAYRDADGWFWFAGRTADWLRVDSENFAAGPVERVVGRFPGVAVAAVYPVPDPRTGDRVMAALQLDVDTAATGFDAGAFATFLAGAPDLGTKWTPSFVRVTADLPVTATRKVDKPGLRRTLWAAREGDRVYERVEGGYVELTDARRADLDAEFAAHGRTALLG